MTRRSKREIGRALDDLDGGDDDADDGLIPENPHAAAKLSPDELHERWVESTRRPDVDSSEQYMRMLEASREEREAARAEHIASRADEGEGEGESEGRESDEVDADGDRTDESAVARSDLPRAVSARLADDVIAELPAAVADDVPDDLPESEVDEAVGLLRELAEQEREESA